MYRINLSPDSNNNSKSIVTIGNFDGLHRGHIGLLNVLNRIASQQNYRRIFITFEPLPSEFFLDQRLEPRLPRLSLLRDKYLILKQANLVDDLIILNFNRQLAKLTPQEFIQQILIKQLNAAHIVVGHDFKFGKDGAGKTGDFHKHGIAVTVFEQYVVDGQRISSSKLRALAQNNSLEKLVAYLGRNIQYTSRVIYGNQIGRKYGVPTINLNLGRNRPALWGIYVALVHIGGTTYYAVASIGKNPTTSNSESFKLEAHLLDIDLNLYGKIATIEILKYLRQEKKFDDLDSLFAQIQQDLQDTRNYFYDKRSESFKNGL